MSDQILTLVIKVDDHKQNETSKKIQQFLIDNDIIKNEKKDNTLQGHGFVPGGTLSYFSDEDPEDYGVFSLITNGVLFIEEQRSFHDYSDIISFKCPTCKTETRLEKNEELKSFWNKIHQYDEGSIVTLNCPKCLIDHSIDQYDYMEQLAFGNIGIEFYNWPPISDSCKKELEEVANSKINVVCSHL